MNLDSNNALQQDIGNIKIQGIDQQVKDNILYQNEFENLDYHLRKSAEKHFQDKHHKMEEEKVDKHQHQQKGYGALNKQKIKKEENKIEYSQYKKKEKRIGETPFMRLKSKINFILEAGASENQVPSVSEFVSSRRSRSLESLSSESIHSNKRYISYLDKEEINKRKHKKLNIYEEKKKIQQKAKNQKVNQFLFYQQQEKIENIIEANRIYRQMFKTQSIKDEKSIRKEPSQVNRQFQQLKVHEEQNKNKKQIKVIFTQQLNDNEAEKISNASMIKVDKKGDQIVKKQVNIDEPQTVKIELKSQYVERSSKKDRSMVRSMQKSRDSKLTPKKNQIQRRSSFEELQNILGEIQQRQNVYKNGISISARSNKKDIKQSFEDIGGNLNMKDRYQQKQKDKILKQTKNKDDKLLILAQNNEQEFQDINNNEVISKRGVKNNQKQVKQEKEKQKLKHDYLKQINIKTQPDQALEELPTSKIRFRVQSKRKLNTQIPQNTINNKKYAMIMKKRQQAISKKIKEQIHVKPTPFFYPSSSQVSKKTSSAQSIQKIDLSSPTKVLRNSRNSNDFKSNFKTIENRFITKKDSNTSDRNDILKTIEYPTKKEDNSKQMKTLHFSKRNNDSGQQLRRLGESTVKNKIKSEYLSSNSQKQLSFRTDSMHLKGHTILEQGNSKISYSNLYRMNRQPISRTKIMKKNNAKQKYDKLKQLLEQI